MIYQVAYKYRMVVEEFERKTEIMNRYILYMESMEFLDMLNYCLKSKIKYFYK
jgi:hypothetical protein